MLARALSASLCLSALAALAACQSSGRYASPAHAGAAVGMAAAGAAASRAMGGCYAECLPGSYCNRASGLCERGEPSAIPVMAGATPASRGGKAPLTVRSTSYPPGHEYEIPGAEMADAGCAPGATSSELGDGGALVCEMDGGNI